MSQDLELQLKAHNIPVAESTWFPSTPSDLNALVKEEKDSPFPHSLPLPTLHEEQQQFLAHEEQRPSSYLQEGSGTEGGGGQGRKRLPIMQFLTAVKREELPTSPPYSPFDQLMLEDEEPVLGDPMLSSYTTHENMDFMT